MKKLLRVIPILLIGIMIFSLCSCDGGDKGGSGKTSGSDKQAIELCEKDEKTLKDHGYTVSIYSSGLDQTAKALGVEEGSIVRMLNARSDTVAMTIYYFKTEAQATAFYNTQPQAYKQVGLRVVYGDGENIIK